MQSFSTFWDQKNLANKFVSPLQTNKNSDKSTANFFSTRIYIFWKCYYQKFSWYQPKLFWLSAREKSCDIPSAKTKTAKDKHHFFIL